MYYAISGLANFYGLAVLPVKVTYVMLYIFSLIFKIISHALCALTQ